MTAPITTSATLAAIIQRWDDAIAANSARFLAVLDEAAAGSEPLIAATRSDLTPLVLPWNTISPRLSKARDEISATWQSISNALSEAGASHDDMRREGNKRDAATLELELLHNRVYGRVMARAADRMRETALASDAGSHACKQCGATLASVRPVAQSLNVECAHCRAVNTVDPGVALRTFAVSGAMFLAAEEARATGDAMRRLELQIKQTRDAKDVPLALLVELEALTRAHWTTRVTVEALYHPEAAPRVRDKLDRHMKDAYRALRRFWQWREHEIRGVSAPV